MVTSTTMATTAPATMATTTTPLTSGTKKTNAQMVPSSIVFGGKRFQLVEMGTTENEMKDRVLDDVLKAPGEANQKEQGQTGSRLSGLPRCISSKAYRDLIMQKEEAKKKIEEEKEKHKHEHKEAKVKKIAEKEDRERNKAIGKGKGNGKGKAPKCKPPTSSTSEDEESDWSSASSEL